MHSSHIEHSSTRAKHAMNVIICKRSHSHSKASARSTIKLRTNSQPDVTTVLTVQQRVRVIIRIRNFRRPLNILQDMSKSNKVSVIRRLKVIRVHVQSRSHAILVQVHEPIIAKRICHTIRCHQRVQCMTLQSRVNRVSKLLKDNEIVFTATIRRSTTVTVKRLSRVTSSHTSTPMRHSTHFITRVIVP